MKIVTLIENIQDDSKKLAHEHGLSLYIETANKTILFDTGETGAFIDNAKKLGINLKNVDMAVLSHGHHDHSGGLLAFFKENDRALVYMKKEASQDFFFNSGFLKTKIGTDKRVFSDYAQRIRYVDHLSEISAGIFLVTDIVRECPTPTGNKQLFVKTGNKLIHDDFKHELILVIKEEAGLNIFTGCSHNGVNNMIQTVRNNFPREKTKTVVGGFHLMSFSMLKFLRPSQAEIEATAHQLQNQYIGKIHTCHCTGENAFRRLKVILGDKIEYLKTGTVLQL